MAFPSPPMLWHEHHNEGSETARVLPVRLSFPAFGAALYLVSELTGEGQAPSIELSYQREKKEGSR